MATALRRGAAPAHPLKRALKENNMPVTVRIPSNVPLKKLPWTDYAQALADLVKKGEQPKILTTLSDKNSHLD